MKLVVQIPCFNEAGQIGRVVASVPRTLPGIACVEVVVADDGSDDGTAEAARAAGAEYVVRHPGNRGLAAAFRSAMSKALEVGADVIVNTDGDDQYDQGEIERLIGPILAGKADVVVGDRGAAGLRHFSPLKRMLQSLGSRVVRLASGTDVADAPSGFRAFSREAALRVNVLSDYSYTLETLVQAGTQRLKVISVPITVRPVERPSRLMRSVPHYLMHSAATMLRSVVTYHPLAVFFTAGLALIAIGMAGVARFLYFYVTEGGGGHVQSVVLAGTLLVVGSLVLLNGLLADMVAANRRLSEEALVRLRRLEANASERQAGAGSRRVQD